MAIARSAHVRDFTAPAATAAPSDKPGFWQRLYAALVVSRQRQAEREIERRFLGPNRW